MKILAADAASLPGGIQVIHLAPASPVAARMSEAITRFDWGRTPLGPVAQWPPTLRIAVDMLLLSPFPKALVWGTDLTVIHNDAYLALLGQKSAAQGDSFDQLWHNAWDHMGGVVFKALEGQGSLVENTALTVLRGGKQTQAWFTCCYSPIRNDQGSVAGFLHALLDTTASVQSTREWRDLAQSFEGQLAHYLADTEHTWQLSPDVMLILDGELRLRTANPAWSRLLGWEQAAQVEGPLLELFHPADRSEVQLALMALEQGIVTNAFEARMRHREGHYCSFRWSATPGQEFPILVGRDITHERQAVQRLAEAALRDSQRMESVVSVAGGLAHEMNNVLSGVGSSLELLERRISQGRLERLDSYVRMARECAQRAIGLTHNLLAFARSQPLAPVAMDVNRVLREAQPFLQQALGGQMSLEWQLDAAPGPSSSTLTNCAMRCCTCAPMRVMRAWAVAICRSVPSMNGLSSPLKGRPGSRLATMCWFRSKMTAMACRKRTWSTLSNRFSPPSHWARGRARLAHGPWLRTPVGGQAWIESTKDKGTRVVLMFPRFQGTLPEPLPLEIGQGQGERVLLVDDEVNLRTLMKEVLVERGFEVCDVTDANAALGQFRHAGPFDLVITDIGLPGGFSGSQVARALRLIRPEQKILFITGFTEQPVEQAMLDEPGTALLFKPFSLETLVGQVHRILKG